MQNEEKKYQSITLSERGLAQILMDDFINGLLPEEDRAEVQRALSFIEDERKLEVNRVNQIPIPKGFTTYPN